MNYYIVAVVILLVLVAYYYYVQNQEQTDFSNYILRDVTQLSYAGSVQDAVNNGGKLATAAQLKAYLKYNMLSNNPNKIQRWFAISDAPNYWFNIPAGIEAQGLLGDIQINPSWGLRPRDPASAVDGTYWRGYVIVK